MGQIVSAAAKPKRCNLNQLSQVPTPAAGEHILVSSNNSMNAAGQGDFDCYIVGDGQKAATALELKMITPEIEEINAVIQELTGATDNVDLTTMVVNNGILYDANCYRNINGNFTHVVIPIGGYSSVIIVANDNAASEFIFTKDYTTPVATGGKADYSVFSPLATGEVGIRTLTAGETTTIEIPSDAAYLICNKKDYKSPEKIPASVTLIAPKTYATPEELNALQQEVNKLENAGSKESFMLPLGVMDNWAKDYLDGGGTRISVLSTGFNNEDQRVFDNGVMVGFALSVVYATSSGLVQNYKTSFLRIRKSANASRNLCIVNRMGGKTNGFPDSTAVGTYLYQQNTTNVFGKVVQNTDDYITIYLPKNSTSNTQYYIVYSYADSTLTTYDELNIDAEHSAMFIGDIAEENIDFNRRYYSRSEKLGSRVRCKNAIVFADSLSAFAYALSHDWGMNIWLMAAGGTRMGYESGSGQGGEAVTKETGWIQNDSRIQLFNASAPANVDFLICAEGSNGILPETNATEVSFVINNKRWYFDTQSSDPFASLSEENKDRFTSTACTYAMFYTMCLHYLGATCVIADIYRTPGAGNTAATWNGSVFANYLFNDNMLAKKAMLKSMAEKLGAIWVENQTRDSIAAANAYHASDGVHPPFSVSTDWASDIALKIGIIHEPLQ